MELIVGRTDDNDIVLAHGHVSRRHAKFTVEGESLWLEDLGSTNGTMVNGRRIQGKVQLRFTDSVSFGDIPFDLGGLRRHVMFARTTPPVVEPRYRTEPEPAPVPEYRPTPAPRHYEEPPAQRISRQERELERAGSHAQVSPGYDVVRALKAQESYVGKAWATFFLYLCFWFPGLIMNLVFLSDANKTGRLVGTNPSGHGCLVFLLWIFVILPLIAIGVLVVGGGSLLSGMPGMLGF
ncbi:FHA domain-containing protein [Candidatus Fermentibacteria bacterium]|nr:FHA domain-containing protein [Candidatus Fermentibacteria bacterium]